MPFSLREIRPGNISLPANIAFSQSLGSLSLDRHSWDRTIRNDTWAQLSWMTQKKDKKDDLRFCGDQRSESLHKANQKKPNKVTQEDIHGNAYGKCLQVKFLTESEKKVEERWQICVSKEQIIIKIIYWSWRVSGVQWDKEQRAWKSTERKAQKSLERGVSSLISEELWAKWFYTAFAETQKAMSEWKWGLQKGPACKEQVPKSIAIAFSRQPFLCLNSFWCLLPSSSERTNINKSVDSP